jgi:hypothetical protein
MILIVLDLCLIGSGHASRGGLLMRGEAGAADVCGLSLTSEIIPTNIGRFTSVLGDSTSRRMSLRRDVLHQTRERRFMITTLDQSAATNPLNLGFSPHEETNSDVEARPYEQSNSSASAPRWYRQTVCGRHSHGRCACRLRRYLGGGHSQHRTIHATAGDDNADDATARNTAAHNATTDDAAAHNATTEGPTADDATTHNAAAEGPTADDATSHNTAAGGPYPTATRAAGQRPDNGGSTCI